jgi:hypothetical protein
MSMGRSGDARVLRPPPGAVAATIPQGAQSEDRAVVDSGFLVQIDDGPASPALWPRPDRKPGRFQPRGEGQSEDQGSSARNVFSRARSRSYVSIRAAMSRRTHRTASTSFRGAAAPPMGYIAQ